MNKIEIKELKELKSSTKVEGKVVKMTNDKWYGVCRICPPRDGWYIRAFNSTTTGRLGTEIFMKRVGLKPSIEECVEMLVKSINGEEIKSDNFNSY